MILAMVILTVSFIPAMQTAWTTDGYLTFVDYISMSIGFLTGSMVCDITGK